MHHPSLCEVSSRCCIGSFIKAKTNKTAAYLSGENDVISKQSTITFVLYETVWGFLYVSGASAEVKDVDMSSDSDWHLVVRVENLCLFLSGFSRLELCGGGGCGGVGGGWGGCWSRIWFTPSWPDQWEVCLGKLSKVFFSYGMNQRCIVSALMGSKLMHLAFRYKVDQISEGEYL